MPTDEIKYLYRIEWDIEAPERPPVCLRAVIRSITNKQIMLRDAPYRGWHCRTIIQLDEIGEYSFYTPEEAWEHWMNEQRKLVDQLREQAVLAEKALLQTAYEKPVQDAADRPRGRK